MKKFFTLKNILLLLAVMLIFGLLLPVLIVNGANNLAISEMLYYWEINNTDNGIPRCGDNSEVDDAEPYLKIANYFDPKGKTTLTNNGRFAWLNGDCIMAAENFGETIEMAPGDERNVIWLFWLGNANMLDVIGVEKLANYTTRLGILANTAGASDLATAWYELSSRIIPSYSVSLDLVNLYKQKEQIGKVKDELQEMLSMVPYKSAEYWWTKGQLAEINGDWEGSWEAYSSGALLAEDPFDFFIRQAIVLEKLGRWEEVEKIYKMAIDARPTHILGYIGLGNVQIHYENFEGALNWFKKAEEIDPENFYPKFIIGELYFNSGLLSVADVYFKESISLNPDFDVTYYYLSRIYYSSGDLDLATETLKMAIDISNFNQWRWLILLGDWQEESGDLQAALDSYYLANDFQPGEMTIIERIEHVKQIIDSQP